MEIQKDFEELLKLFNERKVEYIVVGAFHGVPRFTGDIDILVHPSPENAHNRRSSARPAPGNPPRTRPGPLLWSFRL